MLARQPEPNDVAGAAKSAARLVAEAAFEAPQVHAPVLHPAQVIIRRSRAAGLLVGPQSEAHVDPEAESAARCSRVFRVSATVVPQSGEAVIAASLPALNESTHGSGVVVEAPAPSNSHRIAMDRRPGPVLRVVRALPQRERKTAAAELGPGSLIEALERVTPVLELIERARAFDLADEGVAREWRRLARRIADLRAEIRAQAR